MSAALTLGHAAKSFAQEAVPTDAPANAEPAAPFGFESVAAIAAGVASRPWENPSRPQTGPFADINYDAYRGIRFRRDADPWKDIAGFGLDLLSPGMIFHEPVRINFVTGGVPRPMPFEPPVTTTERP